MPSNSGPPMVHHRQVQRRGTTGSRARVAIVSVRSSQHVPEVGAGKARGPSASATVHARRCCCRAGIAVCHALRPRTAENTYFQMRARRSPLPVAKMPPCGLGATEMTGCGELELHARHADAPEFLWPWSMSWATPVCGFQNCTPRSLDPLSTQSPCGVSATLRTKSCARQPRHVHQPTPNRPYLVALEGADAPPAQDSVVWHRRPRQVPHLDGAV